MKTAVFAGVLSFCLNANGQTVIEDWCRKNYNKPAACQPVTGPLTMDQMSDRSKSLGLDSIAGGYKVPVTTTKAAKAVAPQGPGTASETVLPEGSPLWRFAHPDAGMVAGIRLQALLSSPLVEQIFAMIGGLVPGGAGIETLRKEMAGVDLVIVSMRARPSGQPDVMILAKGSNPLSFTRGQKIPMRQLDPETVIFGEWNAIHYAVQRVLAPATPNAREQRIQSLAGWSDLWMSVDRNFLGTLQPSVQTAVDPAIRRFSLGMTLRNDMTVEAWLETMSPLAANKLMAALHQNPATVPVMADMGKSVLTDLKKEVKGSWVRLYVKIDQDSIAKAFAQRAPAKVQEAPKRKTVVIQGMEGGTKETPIAPK